MPTLTTNKNLFGGIQGSEVEMECVVEAHPRPVNYWIKGNPPKPGITDLFDRPEILSAG